MPKVLQAKYITSSYFKIPKKYENLPEECFVVRWDKLEIYSKKDKLLMVVQATYNAEDNMDWKTPDHVDIYEGGKEMGITSDDEDKIDEEHSDDEDSDQETTTIYKPAVQEAYIDYCVKERAQDKKPLDFVTWVDKVDSKK